MMKADGSTKSFGKDFGTGVMVLLLVALGCMVIAALPLILPILGILIAIALTAGIVIMCVALLGKTCNFVTGVWGRKSSKGE